MTAKQEKENIRNMYKNMVRSGTPAIHAEEYCVIVYGKKSVESALKKERSK